MRILLVEDDPRIAGFVTRGLLEEGHRVERATDAATARITAAMGGFDLWLVDRMLPDGDGLELIRAARNDGDRTPMICLTARDRVDERVQGLTGGADDYLVKPFAFDELLARIGAVSRRAGTTAVLRVADLRIDLSARRVTRGEREIRLTAQEFSLLRVLTENAGRVMSRTRLLEKVWDLHRDPRTNVVDVYIGYLRAKVDKNAPFPLIHTVRGVGYVLEEHPR